LKQLIINIWIPFIISFKSISIFFILHSKMGLLKLELFITIYYKMAKTKVKRLRKPFRKTRRNKRTLKRKYNKRGGVITRSDARSAARSAPYSAAPAPPPMPFPAPPVLPPVPAAAAEPDQCPICLEQEPLCDIMPCGHKLCQTCYDRIVPKNCPFCRQPMIRLKCHNLYNKILEILQGGDPLYEGHNLTSLLKYFYVNQIFTNGLKRRRPNPAYPDWYEHSGIELSEWNKETGKNWVVTIPPSEPNNYAADLVELNALLRFANVIIEQRNTNRGVISYVKFLHNFHTWDEDVFY
jgi:hypothetical protein